MSIIANGNGLINAGKFEIQSLNYIQKSTKQILKIR